MNYLAHVVLAGPDPEAQLGNFLGDFVTGTLAGLRGRYPAAVLDGIALHRRIDTWTDAHPRHRASCARIHPRRRRLAGVIVDVGYDHILTRRWEQHVGETREAFITGFYRLLEQNRELLPERLSRHLSRLIDENWLGCYGDHAGLGVTFARMSRRLRRPELLLGAEVEVARHYAAIEADFEAFFPELQAQVRAWQAETRG